MAVSAREEGSRPAQAFDNISQLGMIGEQHGTITQDWLNSDYIYGGVIGHCDSSHMCSYGYVIGTCYSWHRGGAVSTGQPLLRRRGSQRLKEIC